MFIAICSLLSFLSSLSDLIFSCYVRYNQKMSKIDYIYRDIESNNS